MTRSNLILAAFLVLTSLAATTAQATVLFDASANSAPDAQGWFFATSPLFVAQATQSVGGGVLSLNTRPDISEQAGYFSKVPAILYAHPSSPTIDLSITPYSIEFGMRQNAGSDLPDTDPLAAGQRNRGGFSVIAVSEDLTGIELQFQTDQIVALDDAHSAFPVGEVQAFDTTGALHNYELVLSSGGYQLFADESLVLTGALRNYSGIAPGPPNDFPYTTPSFLFFGDNTGRGEALTELTRFEVSAVPEPTALWVFALGAAFISVRRRRVACGS